MMERWWDTFCIITLSGVTIVLLFTNAGHVRGAVALACLGAVEAIKKSKTKH